MVTSFAPVGYVRRVTVRRGGRADESAVYESVASGLEEFGRVLCDLIGRVLTGAEIDPHSISYRVKSYHSAARKLAGKPNKYGGINELTDLLGLRVITYLADDVDRVSDIVTAEFNVDEGNSVDKRHTLAPDRFGYASLHYVLTLSDSRSALSEYRQFAGRRFELQIRSILQHAWAEIEHDLGYKSERAVPNKVRRRFSRLAGLLELADDEFVAVRDSLTTYARDVQATTKEHLWELEINQSTLLVYLQSAEIVRQLDRYIARQLNITRLYPLARVTAKS